jgi:signal peptidase II
MRKLITWLLVAVGVIVLDQVTKYAIVQSFSYGDVLYITSFFDLVHAHNTGAAFSMLADSAGWQRFFFIGIAMIAALVILALLYRSKGNWLFDLSLSLILGGALGNVIDRVRLGYVIDFIQLHYTTYYWPAFNVADSAITVGAVLIVWDSFYRSSTK